MQTNAENGKPSSMPSHCDFIMGREYSREATDIVAKMAQVMMAALSIPCKASLFSKSDIYLGTLQVVPWRAPSGSTKVFVSSMVSLPGTNACVLS